MNDQELLMKEIEQLRFENEKLKSLKKGITLKASDKGCIQINGLRRFPISLYPAELQAIFNEEKNIRQFINENSDKLSMKNMEN